MGLKGLLKRSLSGPTGVLLLALLCVAVLFNIFILATKLGDVHLPGNQQGYEPEQPIAFSHRLHAGEMEIDCQYCHSEARRSRFAGIPAAGTCMNCHQFVTAPLGEIRAEEKLAAQENRPPRPVVSPELAKLYRALGLNDRMEPGAATSPIEWVRVHRLPDFAYFDHRPHVTAGVSCQSCHGPVETMERVRQVETLAMGWCVNCHRDSQESLIAGKRVHPSTDCVSCHF